MRYAFGDFELDESRFELRRRGTLTPLRPQALDVLLYLVRHRERVVTKTELVDVVWSGAAISSTALAQALVAVRRALDDDGDEQRVIQTVRSRGYRFIAEVGEAQPASIRSRPPLFGREASVAQLSQVLYKASAGEGGVALVLGEPGIGKTRLATELLEIARAAGACVASARCHEGAGAPELWPWTAVVRDLLAEPGAKAALDALGPIAGELDAILPELARGPRRVGDGDHVRLFDAVARLLKQLGRGRPVVLFLDDLHAADLPSLLLLRFATTELATGRVLVVAACRESALVAPAFARTLGALSRADASRCVKLSPLGRADIAKVAEASLGESPSEALTDRLVEKTSGNPLLLTQVLHVMRSEAWMSPADRGATSALLDAAGMREAIELQLDGLHEDCRRTLGVAAVFGARFTLGALSLACGTETSAILPHVDAAESARILAKAPGSGSTFHFVHALVRDVLYRKLSVGERVALHQAAGAALLAQHPSPDGPVLAELARHFTRAAAGGDVARAVLFSARAACDAVARGALGDAAEHLEQALDALEMSPAGAPGDLAQLATEVLPLTTHADTRDRANAVLAALRVAPDALTNPRATRPPAGT